MNTKLSNILQLLIIAISLILGESHAWAQSTIPMPPSNQVPAPMLPITETGTYRTKIEQLKTLREGNKTFEFYQKAFTLLDEFSRLDIHSKQEAATFVWLSYYIAIAPFLTYEEPEEPGNDVWSDFTIKQIHGSVIAYQDMNKITTLLGKNRSQVTDLFVQYLTYMRLSYELANTAAIQELQRIEDAQKRRNNADWARYSLYSTYPDDSFMGLLVGLNNLEAFWGRIEAYSLAALIHSEEGLVEQMALAPNKSGTKMQGYLKNAGYKDKNAQHRILLKTFGRDKNTEWMYSGISKEETKRVQGANVPPKTSKPTNKKIEEKKKP